VGDARHDGARQTREGSECQTNQSFESQPGGPHIRKDGEAASDRLTATWLRFVVCAPDHGPRWAWGAERIRGAVMSTSHVELSPLTAIRAKCLDCSGDSWHEVKLCQVVDCPLWDYRIGQRPKTVRKRAPKFLDRLYMLLAGSLADFDDNYFARQLLADPRSICGEQLAGYTDEQIAGVLALLKATPRGEWFGALRPQIDSGASDADHGGNNSPADTDDVLDVQEVPYERT
jgi:hypothetical protein